MGCEREPGMSPRVRMVLAGGEWAGKPRRGGWCGGATELKLRAEVCTWRCGDSVRGRCLESGDVTGGQGTESKRQGSVDEEVQTQPRHGP